MYSYSPRLLIKFILILDYRTKLELQELELEQADHTFPKLSLGEQWSKRKGWKYSLSRIARWKIRDQRLVITSIIAEKKVYLVPADNSSYLLTVEIFLILIRIFAPS